jgi:hypothetical protein
MAGLVAKSLSDPDEIRPFKDGMGQLELVDLEAGASVARHSSLAGSGPSM